MTLDLLMLFCGPDCGIVVAVWIMAIIDVLIWPFAILKGWF